MRKWLFILIYLILFVASPLNAQPLGKLAHYITHHKEQLLRYGLCSSSIGMDIYSSVHCQNVGNRLGGACIETNPILGSHPSNGKAVSYGIGAIGLCITLDALTTHYAPNPTVKHITWLWATSIAINEYWQYYANSQATKRLENPVIIK